MSRMGALLSFTMSFVFFSGTPDRIEASNASRLAPPPPSLTAIGRGCGFFVTSRVGGGGGPGGAGTDADDGCMKGGGGGGCGVETGEGESAGATTTVFRRSPSATITGALLSTVFVGRRRKPWRISARIGESLDMMTAVCKAPRIREDRGKGKEMDGHAAAMAV